MNTIEKKEVEVVEDFEFRFGKISEPVLGLIDIVKRGKALHLIGMNNALCVYLPTSLQIEHFKKVIAETNNKLNTESLNNGFKREIMETQIVDDFFNFALTKSEFDKYTAYWFDETDLFVFKNQYLNYGEDVDQKIKLPKFQLITDFLALLEYYDHLNDRLTELEKGNDELKSDEKLVKKIDIKQPTQLQEPDESVKDKVIKAFDEKDVRKYFFNESDFIAFTNALATYLSDEEYILPQPIRMRWGGVEKTAKAIQDAFLSTKGTKLSEEKKLFNLMRALSYFEKKKDTQIHTDLQRTKGK